MNTKMSEGQCIIECAVLVTPLPHKATHFVIKVFPPCYKSDDGEYPAVIRNLPLHCFPDGVDVQRCGPSIPSYFAFSQTDSNVRRWYAYCIVFSDAFEHESDGNVTYVPAALCLLSMFSLSTPIKIIMEKMFHLASLGRVSDVVAIVRSFVGFLPVPPPGVNFALDFNELLSEKSSNSMATIPALQPGLPNTDPSFSVLFRVLGVRNIVAIFNALILEYKVVICSRRVSLTFTICEALLALILPLRWQGLYIPMFTSYFIDYIEAPFPFLFGIHTSLLAKIQLEPDTLIVDLDIDTIRMKNWNLPSPPSQLEMRFISDLAKVTLPSEVEHLSTLHQYCIENDKNKPKDVFAAVQSAAATFIECILLPPPPDGDMPKEEHRRPRSESHSEIHQRARSQSKSFGNAIPPVHPFSISHEALRHDRISTHSLDYKAFLTLVSTRDRPFYERFFDSRMLAVYLNTKAEAASLDHPVNMDIDASNLSVSSVEESVARRLRCRTYELSVVVPLTWALIENNKYSSKDTEHPKENVEKEFDSDESLYTASVGESFLYAFDLAYENDYSITVSEFATSFIESLSYSDLVYSNGSPCTSRRNINDIEQLHLLRGLILLYTNSPKMLEPAMLELAYAWSIDSFAVPSHFVKNNLMSKKKDQLMKLIENLERNDTYKGSKTSMVSLLNVIKSVVRNIDGCFKNNSEELIALKCSPKASAKALIKEEISSKAGKWVKSPKSDGVLNHKYMWIASNPPRSACDVAIDVVVMLMAILRQFAKAHHELNEQDLNQIKQWAIFEEFVLYTAELQTVDVTSLSESEKLSFWINVNNIMNIHARIVFDTPRSLWGFSSFLRKTIYDIGGFMLSSSEIEYAIIRAASAKPHCFRNSHFIPKLESNDSRKVCCLTKAHPLVSFGINPCSRKGPKFRVFLPETVTKSLMDSAQELAQQMVKVDLASRRVVLPEIFSWYFIDFGREKRKIIEFVSTLLNDSRVVDLRIMLASPTSIVVTYEPYTWSTVIRLSHIPDPITPTAWDHLPDITKGWRPGE